MLLLFSRTWEARQGGFISPGVRGAICSAQIQPQPPHHALTLQGCTDPGQDPDFLCPRWDQSVLGEFVVGLKQRLGWPLGPGWVSEVTRGSSVAGAQLPWLPAQARLCPGALTWDSRAPRRQSSQGGVWDGRWRCAGAVPLPRLYVWWFLGRKTPNGRGRCS